MILLLSYYWNSIASPLSCPWARQLSWYVPVDASSLCDTAALVGDRIKETSCSVLQKWTASPAALRSCLCCNRLYAVCLHSATEPVPAPSCSVLQTVQYAMIMAAACCISSNHEWWISSQSLFAELSRGWTECVLSLSFIVSLSVRLSMLNNLQRSLFRGQRGANRIHIFVFELQLYCGQL